MPKGTAGDVRGDVIRWVMTQGMRPVGIGLAIGLASAVVIASSLRRLLFDVGSSDPTSLGLVIVVLLTTSALACYVPARRAATMDALAALRHH